MKILTSDSGIKIKVGVWRNIIVGLLFKNRAEFLAIKQDNNVSALYLMVGRYLNLYEFESLFYFILKIRKNIVKIKEISSKQRYMMKAASNEYRRNNLILRDKAKGGTNNGESTITMPSWCG